MRSFYRILLPVVPLALSLSLTTRTADAQTIRALALEGDEIFGVGAVTSIEYLTVNDKGDWLVVVDTNAPTSKDFVLLRNGIVSIQEDDHLASPEGATLDGMGVPKFNNSGQLVWAITMDDVPSTADAGCYLGSSILLQEGQISSSTGFAPGTHWKAFNTTKLNDAGTILCRGSVDDPSIDTTGDATVVRLTLDEYGYLLTEEVVFKEGTKYGGLAEPVQSLGAREHDLALNNRGDFMSFVDTTDSSNLDGNIFYNYESIAREGTFSPVAGRKWTNLSSPRIDLNDFGDYVYTGTIDGDGLSNTLIVKNDEKFVQEGDVVTGIAPNRINNFNTAPCYVANSGKVVWYGQFDLIDTSRNKALFLESEIIAQTGVTRVAGTTLRTIKTTNEGIHVPPNGQYVIFFGVLDDGREGVYLLDLGAVYRMQSCTETTAELYWEEGLPLTGGEVELALDNGQANGVTPILMLSTEPIVGWPPCGIDLGNRGELLIDINGANGNPFSLQFGSPWNGVPSRMDVDIPDDSSLIGVKFYAQGIFWDIGDQLPEQNLLLTNGLEIIIAAK